MKITSMKIIAITLLCAALPLSVAGQTFYGTGVSAETSGRAGILVPSADNPADSLLLNPAGLTSLNGPVVELSVIGVMARGSFSNAANTNSSMSPNNGFVPYFAVGTPLSKSSKWTVAFGVAPDLLSASKWHYNDAPGFGGANYGAQNEKSEILAFRSSAGLAYKLSPKLSLGATFGVIYNANTLDAPYIFQSNSDLAGLKTLLNLHTSGLGYDSSFGITAQPNRRLEFGGSYRTSSSITSSGSASGNMGAQFTALGIPFQPAFAYRAQVHIQLPQSALVSVSWRATPATRISYQNDWTGWHGSFRNLPVTLTKGNNPDINSFLGSDGLNDMVPLSWKDQFTFRGSIDHELGESFSVRAGFLHSNSPVPDSTISPLTAAIMQNSIATGAGYRTGRWTFNVSYTFGFTAEAQVGSSLLLYDEYTNSRAKIGTQSVTFTTAFRL